MITEQELRDFILAMIEAAKEKDIELYRSINKEFSKIHMQYQKENNLPRTTDEWDKARNYVANYFMFLQINENRPDQLEKALNIIEVKVV